MDVEYEDTNSNSSSQQDDEGEDYEDYEYIYSDNEDDDDGNGETGDDEDGNDAFSQNSDVMSLEMESSGGCGAPPSSSKPAQDPLKPKYKRLSGGIGMSRSSSAMMIQNKQNGELRTWGLYYIVHSSTDSLFEYYAIIPRHFIDLYMFLYIYYIHSFTPLQTIIFACLTPVISSPS